MYGDSAIPANATLRQLHVKCGKPQCHCAGAPYANDPTDQAHKHGPYWYAEWAETVTTGKGRRKRKERVTRTAYVGREVPGTTEQDLEEKARAKEPKKSVQSRRKGVPESARQELMMIKCGKPGCRCARQADPEDETGKAHWHGPYWYAVWVVKGKQKKRYLGKETAVF